MSYKSLVYEDIPSDNKQYTFGYAILGEFKVIIMKENGYVNATKLCTTGKIHDWERLTKTKSYIEYLKTTAGFHDVIFIIKIDSGKKALMGSYIHPRLVTDFASWISDEYKFKVSLIMEEYHAREYKEQLRIKDILIDKQGKQIDKKVCKISELKATVDEQSRKIDELLGYAKNTTQELAETKEEVKDIKIDLSDARQDITNKLKVIEVVCSQRVIPEANEGLITSFRIIFLLKPFLKGGVTYHFYIICRQNQTLGEGRHEGKVILTLTSLPNAKNLFNKIIETLTYVKRYHSYINIGDKSQDDFLQDVININESRYVPPKVEEDENAKWRRLYALQNNVLRDMCREHNLLTRGYYKFTKNDFVNLLMKVDC